MERPGLPGLASDMLPAMAKARVLLVVMVAAALVAGCKKKSETKQQAGGGDDAAAVTCDKGQLLDQGKCVPVVTAENVMAVEAQANKLDELQKTLGKLEVLTAPIELMNAIRQLDAWKKFASSSSKFKEVDKVVEQLSAAVDQFKAFEAQLADSRAKLADLTGTLQGIYEGSGAAKTVADARAKVSSEVQAAIEPLQAKVTEATAAIEPMLGELDKLGDIFSGVCALGSISGGGADFKKLCETGRDQFKAAVEFLKAHKDAPKTLLTDLVTGIDREVGDLISSETKQLLQQAQKQVDQAIGTGGDAGAAK